ncbi:MAG: hypothetical protein HOK81_03355, partial [Rhodospirillaceae bacterium]|nr:hypothetical protein [Rhodospirillaceae bacterium]
MRAAWFLVTVGVLLILAAAPARAEAARVEVFSPQGTVKDPRQVAVRFSAPMVALGDPRLADPFTVDCLVSGRGRWADTRNWVYDFDHDLPGGMRCGFALSAGLATAGGEPVLGQQSFSFDTGGPSIRDYLPSSYQSIEEDQIFLLALDAPASPASIAANAHCAVEGLSELIAVDVLEGADRDALLGRSDEIGGFEGLIVRAGRNLPKSDQATPNAQAIERIVALRCQRTLPPESQVHLVWGAGVETLDGIATGQDQSIAFRVRPTFLARFSCEKVNADAACLPMRPMTLTFNTPIPRAAAAKISLIGADGGVHEAMIDGPEEIPFVARVTFPGPFEEMASFRIELPAGLVDDSGRLLANAVGFPLEVATDSLPPLAKFPGEFGILELEEGGVLPVTLRDLEPEVAARQTGFADAMPARSLRLTDDDALIARWMQRVVEAMQRSGEWVQGDDGGHRWVERTGSESVFSGDDETSAFLVPKPNGPKSFEVVGIPLKEPGFHVVELASPKLGAALLGEERPRYVATAALVTNMAVHFLRGRESSLVWVTSLDEGAPVAGAAVRVSDPCTGEALWRGETDGEGIARIRDMLPDDRGGWNCNNWIVGELFVSARKDGDLSFTLSEWGDGISPYDFGLRTGSEWEADLVHTVFDRPLFRAGETVSMKHVLRRHTEAGFALPPGFPGKTNVRITHGGSGQTYDQTADFNARGSALGSFDIPKEAKLGTYDVSIDLGDDSWETAGSFRVEQYRVPTMRAEVQGPAKPMVAPKVVPLDLFVGYLSGGPASGLPVKLRTLVEQREPRFPEYGDFVFGGEDVREGTNADADRTTPAEGTVSVQPLTLDADGAARVSVDDLPAMDGRARLVAELEYQDANGEIRTAANRFDLWPAALSLGIRTDGWVASEEELIFRVLALGLDGKPLAGQAVEVALYSRQSYSYRKRLIGGFYGYENAEVTTRLDTGCAGTTNEQGLLLCDIAPGATGEVVIRAEARDADGNATHSTYSVWVVGEGDWWFSGTDSDRMDLLPERREYQSGETARFQVRMPFRQATALVTVQREGVIDGFVTELSGDRPVVEVPVRDNYSPNVFVSVLALRGRVGPVRSWLADLGREWDVDFLPKEGGEATALVDLSKPAYRLGMAEIRVGWQPHRLDVRVETDKQVYDIRGTAKVRISARRADGSAPPEGTEIALAAVDDGLLELAPNPSWDLLSAMMGERGIEVRTATAQMQVVGKRHYGRKAVPAGGGGGRATARELFDTLLLWRGRVVLDADGTAEVDIPLNDSLTSYSIVAVATGGLGLFGTGKAEIRTSQDLILLSGLPPLVRTGDKFDAVFTLRNTTAESLTVQATAVVTPSVGPLPDRTVTIEPGAAHELTWEAVVPAGARALAWDVSAGAAEAEDRVAARQEVAESVPVRVYQATLAQIAGLYSQPVARPADALPGRGGIAVSLRAGLAGPLDAVEAYMAAYPYTCFEQKASKAVALHDDAAWADLMARAPGYLDSDGLAKYFPSDWLSGSDVLTSYVLAVADEADRPIPDGTRQAMIGGLTKFVEGRIMRRGALRAADLDVRKLAAIAALARYGAAKPEMLTSLEIAPELLPTSALIDWIGILGRLDLPDRGSHLDAARQNLRSRLNFQGTTMGFSTERGDGLWWLMVSTDSNAVRAVLAMLGDPQWREDMPRMLRGALARRDKGRWGTTVANAWGVLAVDKFAAAFEADPVTGRSTAQYGAAKESVNWRGTEQADLPLLPWADGPADLDLRHEGTGKPWAFVQAKAAIPLKEPLSSGYRITRKVEPVSQAEPGVWRRGDVARVTLEVEAQADMTWVVFDDPVPAGAAIL